MGVREFSGNKSKYYFFVSIFLFLRGALIYSDKVFMKIVRCYIFPQINTPDAKKQVSANIQVAPYTSPVRPPNLLLAMRQKSIERARGAKKKTAAHTPKGDKKNAVVKSAIKSEVPPEYSRKAFPMPSLRA